MENQLLLPTSSMRWQEHDGELWLRRGDGSREALFVRDAIEVDRRLYERLAPIPDELFWHSVTPPYWQPKAA
jgi:hypothetical protein